MRNCTLIIIVIFIIQHSVLAQENFPQNEFQNPLQIPIALAGSFAECRPNHFHTGIDLKTNNKENLSVLAAADGYISRISISHSGYGNCLYVSHPNGYTTVYGHLNNFVPSLMGYIKQQQYVQKKWNIDIKLPIDSFIFKKGQQIAFSGNTGGSTAPHLHFEIRDTKTERVYNPLLFGFKVQDNIAPKAKQLAYYNVQAFYDQKPTFVNLGNAINNTYQPSITILNYPKAFVGIDVQDFVNGSNNWLGIKQILLYVDNNLTTDIELSGLWFNQNRAINAYADFRTFKARGIWFQGLYQLPFNPLEIYKKITNRGIIDLSDGNIHTIKIVMKDAFNNQSIVHHKVQFNGKINQVVCNQKLKALQADYYKHHTGNVYFFLPDNSLYDDVCLKVNEKLNPNGQSGIFEILNPQIPCHNYFELGIKPYNNIPKHLEKKLVFVHKIPQTALPGSNSQNAQSASFKGLFAVANVRSFGQYYLAIDTIAPVIKMISTKGNKTLSFSVSDNYTQATFNVYINDNWACFSRKGNVYSYTLSNLDPKGKLNIKAIAIDENENISTSLSTLTN